jgi:hypothetical protein
MLRSPGIGTSDIKDPKFVEKTTSVTLRILKKLSCTVSVFGHSPTNLALQSSHRVDSRDREVSADFLTKLAGRLLY